MYVFYTLTQPVQHRWILNSWRERSLKLSIEKIFWSNSILNFLCVNLDEHN